MREVRVALIQFDAVPEQVDENLERMETFVEQAAGEGARWVMFHEGTVCDYTPDLEKYSEPVPEGHSTQRMMAAARAHDCFVSFGLSERADDRYYISQVFLGPEGLVHCYRKTWIWHS